MGKIVSIVGNTGAGKTTLARVLRRAYDFNLGLEQHEDRPFQRLFHADKKFALANQVDYLVLRASQERDLRAKPGTALIDGGLDLDFHGFSKLFLSRGYLTVDEFNLCSDLYHFIRSYQALPDLFIYLKISRTALLTRLESRNRINIAQPEDLDTLADHFNEWLTSIEETKVLLIDAENEDSDFSSSVPVILDKMKALYII